MKATAPRQDDAAHLSLALADEAATARLGAALGLSLAAGDVVALTGGLGAGKSALARAAIRARLGDPMLEVPSPTYTLINVFEPAAGPAIWHGDLYRLASLDEVAELGLEEAFGSAVCLIEWAERLGELAPARRLEVALSVEGEGEGEGEGRRAEITAHGGGWARVMDAISNQAGAA